MCTCKWKLINVSIRDQACVSLKISVSHDVDPIISDIIGEELEVKPQKFFCF